MASDTPTMDDATITRRCAEAIGLRWIGRACEKAAALIRQQQAEVARLQIDVDGFKAGEYAQQQRALAAKSRAAELQTQAEALRKDAEAKQAKIDRLMLEYCPDEMTQEQLAEWKRNQKPVCAPSKKP